MRVAWVDSSEAILLVVERMLLRTGSECRTFADHAALLAVVDGSFDVAVLHPTDDIAADDARAELRRRGVAEVLLCSGSTAEDMRSRGIDVEAFDGFLAKPFTFGELREALGLVADRGEVAS